MLNITQGSWIATINCLDAANNPTVIYFSDDGYKSPDGRYYSSRMKQPAKVTITGNDGGLLGVMQQSSIGEIELDNTDGKLDYLCDYKIDGRDCTLQLVFNRKITTWFKGMVTRLNQRGNSVFITLKSLTEALDTPLVLARYAGTGGTEGLTTDIMGTVKPRVYGSVINAAPVLCFATSGVYQVSDLATTIITAVYDKGVALTAGTVMPDLASLLSSQRCMLNSTAVDTSPAAQVSGYYSGTFTYTGGISGTWVSSSTINTTSLSIVLTTTTGMLPTVASPYTTGFTFTSTGSHILNTVTSYLINTSALLPGTYDTFQGYFRLGTTAVQQITCSASDTLSLAGDIFKQIGNSVNFSSGQRTIGEQPIVLNDTLHYYQMSTVSGTIPAYKINNVYNDGAAMTSSGEYATLADFNTNTPPPTSGNYKTYRGYFRINLVGTLGTVTYDSFNNVTSETISNSTVGISVDLINHIYVISTDISDIQAYKINNVYNDGNPLTFGVERITNTLSTIAPTVGTYDTYAGYLRINPQLQSAPNPSTGGYDPIVLGNITCSATDLSVTYATTYSLKVNETAITGAVAILNTCGGIGIYINSDTTVRAVLDTILKSVGGFWWFGDATNSLSYNSNLLNAALYSLPSVIPDLTVNNWQITAAERTAIAVAPNGLPFYSVLSNYNKVETQQSDVLGATTDAWRARVLKGSIIKESADLNVKLYHPQATRLTFESALKSDTDISSVTDRLLLQFKSRCDIVSITCYFSSLPRLTLNMTIKVLYNRLGYSQGVSFRLVGYELDIKRKSVTMQLMGYTI